MDTTTALQTYLPPLRGHCLRLANGDDPLAEDFASQAVVRYLEYTSTDGVRVNHWGHLIRRAIDAMRYEYAACRQADSLDALEESGWQTIGDASPETLIVEAETERERHAVVLRVLEAMPALSAKQRAAIEARINDGLSFSAAGEQLGVSEAAATMAYRRGLQALRETLATEIGSA